MGRLFSFFLFSLMLLNVPARSSALHAQPVFFSILFPQLMPGYVPEDTAGEAVCL